MAALFLSVDGAEHARETLRREARREEITERQQRVMCPQLLTTVHGYFRNLTGENFFCMCES